MMAYAIQQGVPPEDIQPDYGGRRTYDTCYRAKKIFGVESAVLVTQAFHLPRALFLCNSLDLESSGVIADRRVYDSDARSPGPSRARNRPHCSSPWWMSSARRRRRCWVIRFRFNKRNEVRPILEFTSPAQPTQIRADQSRSGLCRGRSRDSISWNGLITIGPYLHSR